MTKNYYITNGVKMIGVVGNRAYAPIIGSLDLAKRFKYKEALDFININLSKSSEWCIQKVFQSKSGKNYIITNATNFAGGNGIITNNFVYAKRFQSISDAKSYIRNHHNFDKAFGKAYIINESFEKCFDAAEQNDLDGEFKVTKVPIVCNRASVPKQIRASLYEKSSHHCSICGKPLAYDEMTVDHIVPVSRGGGNKSNNLRCVCKECNNLKGNRLDAEMYTGLINICSVKAVEDPDNNIWDKLIRAKVRGTINKYGGKE